MRSNRGFSFIEIIIVIAVLGILTALAAGGFNKAIKSGMLEKEAWKVRQFLVTAKPLAMKMDSRTKVKFAASACSIFVNDGSDSLVQWKYSSRIALTHPVFFGLPVSPPASGPAGSSIPGSGKPAGGGWDSCLAVNKDAIGTINGGTVYISSSKLSKITYCIRLTDTEQVFKMFKWDGSSWNVL